MKKKNHSETYHCDNPQSAIANIQFSAQTDEPYAVILTNPGQGIEQISALLRRAGVQADIISATPDNDGRMLINAHMHTPREQVVSGLQSSGVALVHDSVKQGVDPMALRGCTSVLGQTAQFISAATTVKEGKDLPKGASGISADIMGFASLNMLANICNFTFGSQHKIDHHRTLALKEAFNESISPLVQSEENLPNVRSKALDQRYKEPLTFGQQAYNFAKSQSITIGEVALRMFGTASMIFPVNQWGDAAEKFRDGNYGEAVKAALNNDEANLRVGLVTMGGKLTSLIAKEEDPYNPKEQNALDVFREKYAFKASSLIEGYAAADMMIDRYKNRHSKIGVDPANYDPTDKAQYNALPPDYAGAVGNGIFVLGYGIRFPAKVGTLDVDMPELYAHISDGLAQLPRAEIPQVLAQTVRELDKHFKDDKHINAADIYAGIAADLQNHHFIDVMPLEKQQAASSVMGGVVHLPKDAVSIIVEPPRQKVAEPAYQQRVDERQLALATAPY